MRMGAALIVLIMVLAMPLRAEILCNIWEKYAAGATEGELIPKQEKAFPGRNKTSREPDRADFFYNPWKYRATTYEQHFASQRALAASVYGLALSAGDIDATMKRDVFLNNVLGFHYSVAQVCSWLMPAGGTPPLPLTVDEQNFVDELKQDGVIALEQNQCSAAGLIQHVVAATQGRKRTFEQNLRHERLHVFWDEDQEFRDASYSEWKTLSEQQRVEVKNELHQYAQSNELQLIEEWAVKQAEKNRRDIP